MLESPGGHSNAPAGGSPMRRTGDTLTILRKTNDGMWTVFRDANLLAAAPPETSDGASS
ncbi:uncharacterized protein sS8_4370 [Methylocaldum marinum]|uniref:Uncharacterized protein n=1 Tax=Methylocaldum marinum TaxID=1432792 RepID=A0A250KXC4_9GAMM|nr:uncharacterized protein sS8_4370 [Methylocaldum marinum]